MRALTGAVADTEFTGTRTHERREENMATIASDVVPGRRIRPSSVRNASGIAIRVPDFQLPVWDTEIPILDPVGRRPAVWLLRAHGGAGVSTLERVLAPAGDCFGRWPGCVGDESPFVVVVARETVPGLIKAQDLLRAHAAGLAGPSQLLGLITVADRPGRRPPAAIRRTRELTAELTEHAWRLGWIEDFPLTADLGSLPSWSPLDPPPAKPEPGGVPAAVTELGTGLHTTLRSALSAFRS